MNILVCIKQVPDTTEIRMDPKTNTLIRAGVPSTVNPFDKYALEAAVQLRETLGGTVTAMTMGPAQAAQALRECYALGADRMVLVSDRRFGGADTYATSYTLAQAVRALGGFDLILCGKQTTDGDTAQVGPAIAEHMGIPHAAWVSRIEAETNGVVVEQQLQDVIETVRMPFPCLVTVEQDIYMPRLPSLKTARRVADRPVHVMGLDSFLDTDPEHYGLSGSPTQVERIFPPENDVQREQWTEENAAEKLHGRLKQWKFA